MPDRFLPTTKKEMDERGWREPDVVIVTGDAYCDHPSYGASVIGRVLEDAGFKVGIIDQPDWRKPDDFTRLGRPKLFFGVTSGNLDSMVANYTANKKIRSSDEYAPGGKSGLRPDRAVIAYTNRIRQAYGCIPIVLGGIEASLRRLAHYDYWSDKVRRSILLDSKADILVYGMGEQQVLEIARRLASGEDMKLIDGIKGTAVIKNSIEGLKDHVEASSFEEICNNRDKFNKAFLTAYSESDPYHGKTVVQKHADRYIIQFPPALPLTTAEMDKIYGLPYARGFHPAYDRAGGIPGFESVRFSVISHRGCPGACNFCSLYLHQGRIIQSRSAGSVLNEIKLLSQRPDFKGTITDIGGPTANLYKTECPAWEKTGACRNKKCLVPAKCRELRLGYNETVALWEKASKIPKVKHIFVGSGVRYDILTEKASDKYLKELCASHVSGQLKVAPEHTSNRLLSLMNKPSFKTYEKFAARFDNINKRIDKQQYLVNYLISAHPGSTLEDALDMSLELMKHDIYPEQIQDYLPLPMTASGCMYHTEKDPFTGKKVYVAKGLRERKMQRAIIQYKNPENKRYVIEILRSLDKMHLIRKFYR